MKEKEFTSDNIFENEKVIEHEKLKGKENEKSRYSNKTSMILCLILIFIIFLTLMIFILYIHYGMDHTQILVNDFSIIKPIVDIRKYRVVRLPNDLEVLLISDKDSLTCAASMSVGVGSFNDDKKINGLSHLLEHMLFLGSATYPNPHAFSNHLKEYLGSSNSTTEEQKTTYYFEIENKGFDSSLLLFSKFFSEPLLDYDYMKKEIDVIESEHHNQINQENWRHQQIIKALSNSNHPFNMYSTGKKSIFKNIFPRLLHQKLIDLFKKFYVPTNMRLTVISNQDLQIIQDQITKYFSNLRIIKKLGNNNRFYGSIVSTNENAFYHSNLGKLVYWKRDSSSISLDIVFSIEEILSKNQYKPEDYLTYLIKFSGEGSLIEYLKENKFAFSLNAGIKKSFTDFSQYSIMIDLTNEGFDNIRKVIQMTFTYINILKETYLHKETYLEIKKINDIKFRFLEKNLKNGEYISYLSRNMFDYKYKDILYSDFMHKEFNDSLIHDFLNSIKPENSIIIIGAQAIPNYNFTSTYNSSQIKNEKWYGIDYFEIKLSEMQINELSKKNDNFTFAFRPENLFLTKEINLRNCNSKIIDCFNDKDIIEPKIFYDDTKIRIWTKSDNSFRVPKTYFSLNIKMKNMITSPYEFVKIRVFTNYLTNIFEKKLSDAMESGNKIRVDIDDYGINITVEAYSDLVHLIFRIIAEHVFSSKFKKRIFYETLAITEKDFRLRNVDFPTNKFSNILQRIIKPNGTFYTEEFKLLKNITFDDFAFSLNIFRRNMIIESLFYGDIKNVNLWNIKNNFLFYTKTYDLNASSLSLRNQEDFYRVFDISNEFVYRSLNEFKDEVDHYIANYYQIGFKDIKLGLIMDIIELSYGKILNNELLRKNQFINSVFTGKTIIDNILYYEISLQECKKSPDILDVEIKKIIEDIHVNLDIINRISLKKIKQTLRNQILKPDFNLFSRFEKVWKEIRGNRFEFENKLKILTELDKITVDDVKKALNDFFFINPHKLSIQIIAEKSTTLNNTYQFTYLNKGGFKNNVFNDMDYFRHNKASFITKIKENLSARIVVPNKNSINRKIK